MPTRRVPKPDLEAVLELASPAIAEAVKLASATLAQAGIRHVLVGGLAAGAYGRPRSTKDVDFLVGNEAFLAAGSVLMHRPGVPFAVGKVPVDTIPLPVDEPWFEEALQPACYSAGIPIVSVEFLVLMKLRAGRLRDQMDIGAVVQEGADLDSVRRLLQQRDPVLLPEFDRIAATAMSESEG